MRFRNLDYPRNTPVSELGAAAIDNLLERGSLEDWIPLLRHIKREPFGPLSELILRIVNAHPMYGTSNLWRAFIKNTRTRGDDMPRLTELRRDRGLSQIEVARRLGISQSDVSKLERRSDMKLSTLREYVRALGANMKIVIEPTAKHPSRSKG